MCRYRSPDSVQPRHDVFVTIKLPVDVQLIYCNDSSGARMNFCMTLHRYRISLGNLLFTPKSRPQILLFEVFKFGHYHSGSACIWTFASQTVSQMKKHGFNYIPQSFKWVWMNSFITVSGSSGLGLIQFQMQQWKNISL